MGDVKLNIVMVPWLAFGHMIPFLELSKCLAKRGHRISFVSTPRNIDRLPHVSSHLSPLINLVKLIPPSIDGLPSDAQATVDVQLDGVPYIEKLQDSLDEPMRRFLEEQDPRPDWIIFDLFVHWAPQLATEFGLKSAIFSVLSAATLSFAGPPSALIDELMYGSPEQMTVVPRWITIPSDMAYRHHEAIRTFETVDVNVSNVSRGYRFGTSIQGCNLVAVRSSPEFEPEWLVQLAGLYPKPVIPTGFLSPLSLTHQENGTIWKDEHWLNSHKHGSTVYVAFGSELRLTREQVTELAFGLELSDLPFFWAYRGDPAMLPSGFEERVEARGLVQMGWAPQPKFLAHPSIGGFLMHGGWGSAIEALAFGKPLIMIPMINDQGMNSRLMEEKKVGVEVARNEKDGSFTRDAVAKTLKLVMVEPKGETIRANAREMQNIFGDKCRDGQYMDEFVQCLVERRCV